MAKDCHEIDTALVYGNLHNRFPKQVDFLQDGADLKVTRAQVLIPVCMDDDSVDWVGLQLTEMWKTGVYSSVPTSNTYVPYTKQKRCKQNAP